MKERGILFSGEMVRAILAGSKTQTRRVVKPLPDPDTRWRRCGWSRWDDGRWGLYVEGEPIGMWGLRGNLLRCPYGYRGHRLWVRETWRPEERESDLVDGIRFAADDAFMPIAATQEAAERWVCVNDGPACGRWRPSIHMPRWASRITLEVTDVRVERVQDISEEDAIAEGVCGHEGGWFTSQSQCDEFVRTGGSLGGPRHNAPTHAFRALWDSLAPVGARWTDSLLWVWVVTFRRIGE